MTAEVLDTNITENIYSKACPHTMDDFLRSIQKPAYRMASISTQSREDALDLVQDAMVKLLQNYSDKPAEELKPLFYRILSSKLTDWHRKRQFRSKFHWLLGSQDEEHNLIETIAVDLGLSIEDALVQEQDMVELFTALSELSERQRQVVLLRHWQGFSVQETADILNCSTGSIKTHLHRATQMLKSNAEIMLSEDNHES